MGILDRLRRSGLTARAQGTALLVEPKAAITDQLRALIRTHKADILGELGNVARQQRRAQAVQMLCERHTRLHSFVAGEERDGRIPVAIAIRAGDGLVVGEAAIPKARWDESLFLRFLKKLDEQASSCGENTIDDRRSP